MGYGKYKKTNHFDNSYFFYKDFTSSIRWLEFRDRMLRMNGYKCDICGASSTLNVHHRDLNPRNYTNLSNPLNFRLLCRECHSMMHALYDCEEAISDLIVIEQLKLSFLTLPQKYFR